MFRYKANGQNSTSDWALQSGKPLAKPLMKRVKRNKRVMAKSEPPHVENVGSRKSQYPLNKHMLPFLGTATPRA